MYLNHLDHITLNFLKVCVFIEKVNLSIVISYKRIQIWNIKYCMFRLVK